MLVWRNNMREFKFRVWDGVKFSTDPRNDIARLLCEPKVMSFASFGKIIQQFTGLTDKNGKEIYEGDILFSSKLINGVKNKYFIVCWNPYLLNFCLDLNGSKYKKLQSNFADLTFPKSKSISIIGNIFENPELVEK